jgi:hypothetical protein
MGSEAKRIRSGRIDTAALREGRCSVRNRVGKNTVHSSMIPVLIMALKWRYLFHSYISFDASIYCDGVDMTIGHDNWNDWNGYRFSVILVLQRC